MARALYRSPLGVGKLPVSRRCRGRQALWDPRLNRLCCHCRHHTESLLEGQRPGLSPGGEDVAPVHQG